MKPFLSLFFLVLGVFPAFAQSPLLPQKHQYQIELYDWLETLTVADVTVPVGASVNWDFSHLNDTELANLWLNIRPDGDNKRGWNASTMSEARWYVLDDGQGHGIEGYGRAQGDNLVRLPREGDATGGILGMASQLAWWYHFDLPLPDGGQGNPLHQHRGAGLRSLVIAAVDMMMLQECIETYEYGCTSGWGDRTDYIGGYLISVAETLLFTGDEISPEIRLSFMQGMEQLVDRMLELGARDINSNMDGKAIEGCAYTWKVADKYAPSHALKSKCEALSRLVLFGYEDGQIKSRPYKIDSDKGIFYLEGLIREADGPETTYNGRSIAHLAAARTSTYEEDSWSFLDDVLTRMCDFMFTQFYEQPSQNQKWAYQTPTGYSNRTWQGVRSPQDTPWANISMGYMYEECRPMLWTWKFNADTQVKPVRELGKDINRYLGEVENVPEHNDVPKQWLGKEPWPTIAPFLPPAADWYQVTRGYIDSGAYYHMNDSRRNEQYNRTFPSAEDVIDNWQNEVQWWSRRAGSESNEFIYFIEGTNFSGTYQGYYSGKLETFWRERQGPIVLNHREAKWAKYDWAGVDRWRIDHVWGYDEQGQGFSWGKVNGDKDQSSPSARKINWDGAAQRFEVITPMEDRGESSPDVLGGQAMLTKTFESLNNGLKMSLEVSSNSQDEINELWFTLPLYEGTEGDEGRMPRAFRVDIWTGSAWEMLGNELTEGKDLRIGHNWGSGFVYTYFAFDSNRSIRLLEADTNVDRHHLHLLQVDLHGNPGTTKMLPASTSLSVDITTEPENTILGEEGADEGTSIDTYELNSPYPNPFSNEVNVTFDVPRTSNVKIAVFDVLGREVVTLVDELMVSGKHKKVWEPENIGAGSYILRLETPEGVKMKSLSLVK